MEDYKHTPRDSRTGELIADILRPEGRDFTALSFGEAVEAEVTLAALSDTTLPELVAIWPAFNREDFKALTSAVELGRRVEAALHTNSKKHIPFTSSEVAIDYCRQHFQRLATDATREEFHILTLDTKNRLINAHLISVGVLDCSLVHPREVYRPAIRDSAASIMAVHNHPSGDPTPSREDFETTHRLRTAGELVGIKLLDHIVVARDGAVSIKEANLLKDR